MAWARWPWQHWRSKTNPRSPETREPGISRSNSNRKRKLSRCTSDLLCRMTPRAQCRLSSSGDSDKRLAGIHSALGLLASVWDTSQCHSGDLVVSNASPTNPPALVPTEYPKPTEADSEAMFASVVWFRTHQSDPTFDQYEGKYVAILGERILDTDSNHEELIRRLDAMCDELPPNRVVIQYVHGLDEPLRY
jgi:hypothetical protein